MKTFVTEIAVGKKKWRGPEIKANSWAKAETKAHKLEVKVIGVEA